MRKDIRVSFVDNEEEDKLHDDIIDESKRVGACQAKWMKIAAREKLERDCNNGLHKTNVDNTYIPQGGVVNSIEEWFTPQ